MLTLVNFQLKEYRVSIQLKYQYLATRTISKNWRSQIITQVILKFSDVVQSYLEITRMSCIWLWSDQQENRARLIHTE